MNLYAHLFLFCTIGSAALTRRAAALGSLDDDVSLSLQRRYLEKLQERPFQEASGESTSNGKLRKRGNCVGKPCGNNRRIGASGSRGSHRPATETSAGRQGSSPPSASLPPAASSDHRMQVSTSPRPSSSRDRSPPSRAGSTSRQLEEIFWGRPPPSGSSTNQRRSAPQGHPEPRNLGRMSPDTASRLVQIMAHTTRLEFPPLNKPVPGRPVDRTHLGYDARRQMERDLIPPFRRTEFFPAQAQRQAQSHGGRLQSSGAETVQPSGASRERSRPSASGSNTPSRSPTTSDTAADKQSEGA